jgi:hypothetical protein
MTHGKDVIVIVGGAVGGGMGAAVAASISRHHDLIERVGGTEIPLGARGLGAGNAGELLPDLRFPKEPKARDWEQRSRRRRSR